MVVLLVVASAETEPLIVSPLAIPVVPAAKVFVPLLFNTREW
jgi:hypothetical protein